MPPPSCTGTWIVARISSTALVIHRPAHKRAVEIDHMQPLEALLLEGACLRRRILIEHRRLVHLASAQADALTVFQVDGGEQDHDGSTMVTASISGNSR